MIHITWIIIYFTWTKEMVKGTSRTTCYKHWDQGLKYRPILICIGNLVSDFEVPDMIISADVMVGYFRYDWYFQYRWLALMILILKFIGWYRYRDFKPWLRNLLFDIYSLISCFQCQSALLHFELQTLSYEYFKSFKAYNDDYHCTCIFWMKIAQLQSMP